MNEDNNWIPVLVIFGIIAAAVYFIFLAPSGETRGVKSDNPDGCDPNYSGCVPIASDVDCAGGSGNGPAYVAGPVRVTGYDIYGLDRDGDGYGCE